MKTGSWLIRGGRIVDPAQGVDQPGSLLIAGGKVAWRGETPPPAECAVIDASGLVVCPGFIDLHCHLRQPGFEEKETIASGTLAAARGGFTTVCCMPNTRPPLDSPAALEYVRETAAAEGAVRVLPIACVTRERKGEELADMEALAGAGAVGFSDDGSPVLSPQLMRRALEQGRALGLPVIDHCEDTALTSGGQVNQGIVSRETGLGGMPAAAEESMVLRDLALARQTGGRLHIAHVSTAGAVELIRRAKEEGVSVTAEATPHHLTLTEQEARGYNTNAKVTPPLRTADDVQALVRGLREGVIDVIATDHAPHTAADKQGDFARAAFGISGLETALGSLMALVHGGQLTLAELIARLTCLPAKIINRPPGTLKKGAAADITIFDPDREWVVDPAQFASKGKNTPLAGRMLRGRVLATLYQGRLVYKDDLLKIAERAGRVNYG